MSFGVFVRSGNVSNQQKIQTSQLQENKGQCGTKYGVFNPFPAISSHVNPFPVIHCSNIIIS